MNNNLEVAIVGLINSPNLGEAFIADSLEYLIKTEYERTSKKVINFHQVSIFECTKLKNKSFIDYIYILGGKVARHIPGLFIKNTCYKLMHWCWNHGNNGKRKYYSVWEKELVGSDIIIIDGAGLLEYSANEYQEPLYIISKIANDNKIPVVYNAVGTAGDYNEKDFRCKLLKKAVSADCVKYISARDSQEIVQKYAKKGMYVKQCSDAAVCLNEAYGIERCKDSNLIGIGLIRGTALQSYGEKFDENDWIRLFCNIARELDKRGYKYIFFTNGSTYDYDIGLKIIDKLQLNTEYLVQRPLNSIELANTISTFSGMITCRMHSAIAGFSMGIPSVVLSWNKKLNKLMEWLGTPERAINVDNFNSSYIVDQLEKSLAHPYTAEQMLKVKESAKESVRGYLNLLE